MPRFRVRLFCFCSKRALFSVFSLPRWFFCFAGLFITIDIVVFAPFFFCTVLFNVFVSTYSCCCCCCCYFFVLLLLFSSSFCIFFALCTFFSLVAIIKKDFFDTTTVLMQKPFFSTIHFYIYVELWHV